LSRSQRLRRFTILALSCEHEPILATQLEFHLQASYVAALTLNTNSACLRHPRNHQNRALGRVGTCANVTS
jgi:hypothetical protein